MTNEEYLKKWYNHSNVLNFNFDDIYSALLLEKSETIDEFLEFVHIDKTKLIESKSKTINQSLEEIDELLLQTSEELRVFVIDNLFEDTDDDDVMNNYHQTKSEIYEIFNRIHNEIVSIQTELEG
jgi:hypothetical protein